MGRGGGGHKGVEGGQGGEWGLLLAASEALSAARDGVEIAERQGDKHGPYMHRANYAVSGRGRGNFEILQRIGFQHGCPMLLSPFRSTSNPS